MPKNPYTNSKILKLKNKKWSKMLTQTITFIECSAIIFSGYIVCFCTFLHALVLYSFEMVKFFPKTCRLKNEKHKFVNVRSKAESSKKSYGSFEAEHVV